MKNRANERASGASNVNKTLLILAGLAILGVGIVLVRRFRRA